MPTAATPNPLMNLLPILFIVVIFYVVVWMPQRKQMKERKQMLSELKKGDAVVTSGGMHGIVSNVRGPLVDLKVNEETKITFSKDAITYIKKPQDIEQENKVEVVK
ncbi:MAG: preprotein translocase subunit YajC [bacterium]|nr:preprotein translocase subunit YajC [bacterium]MDD5354499.1 preprotein translocase subunit YajC [bacterium]